MPPHKVFLVVEEAVARHRIMGVYHTFEDAVKRAYVVATQEDGYHIYDVDVVYTNIATDDVKNIGGFVKTLGRSRVSTPGVLPRWQWPIVKEEEENMKAEYGEELLQVQNELSARPPEA